MTLKEKLLLEKITSLSELGAAQQSEASASPEMMAIIEQNRLLAAESGNAPEAPQRSHMLTRVYRTAEELSGPEAAEVEPMNWINRNMHSMNTTSRIAFGSAMLVAFCAVVFGMVLMLDTGAGNKALAATDGYVLRVTFDNVSSEDAVHSSVDRVIEIVKQAKAEYGKTDPSVLEKKNVIMSTDVSAEKDGPDSPEVITASVIIGMQAEDYNEGLMDALEAALANAAGIPTPSRESLTVFSENGLFDLKGGINIKMEVDGEVRTFSFPDSATEEEIEHSLTQWLRENDPDGNHSVDVTIERDGDKVRVEVKVEDSKGSAGAGASAGR